jgi:large subunit ribosomal protein L30
METTATKRKAPSSEKKQSSAVSKGSVKKTLAQPAPERSSSTLRLTQVRSFFGILPNQKACLIGLGLRKIHSTSVVQDTPSVRGMITKVRHLIRVEDGSVCN